MTPRGARTGNGLFPFRMGSSGRGWDREPPVSGFRSPAAEKQCPYKVTTTAGIVTAHYTARLTGVTCQYS